MNIEKYLEKFNKILSKNNVSVLESFEGYHRFVILHRKKDIKKMLEHCDNIPKIGCRFPLDYYPLIKSFTWFLEKKIRDEN